MLKHSEHQAIAKSGAVNLTLKLAMALFVIVIAYSLVLAHQVGGGSPSHIGTQVVIQTLSAYVLMFLVWKNAPQNPNLEWVRTLFLVGILARLLLLFVEPYTSNDVSRYLFDGRILLEGLDPYRIAHDAPELMSLRAQWQPPQEHAKYVTLYPPLALSLCAIASSFGSEHALIVWKSMTTLASIATSFVAYKVLKRAELVRHLPLVLLSPLLILEAGESAHIDVFSALAVITAIWAWQCQRNLLAGLVIGLGVSVKLLPLLLLMPLAVFSRTWLARVKLCLGVLICLALVYGAALFTGLRPVGSISVFFTKWRSSSPLFHWLEPYLGQAGMLYLVLSLATVFMLALLVWGWRSRNKPMAAAFVMMQATLALPLLLSPVVFSWYLMPMAVLFALRPNVLLALWLITLPISYEVLNQFLCCGVWNPAAWAVNLIGMALVTGSVYSIINFFRSLLPKNQSIKRSLTAS